MVPVLSQIVIMLVFVPVFICLNDLVLISYYDVKMLPTAALSTNHCCTDSVSKFIFFLVKFEVVARDTSSFIYCH